MLYPNETKPDSDTANSTGLSSKPTWWRQLFNWFNVEPAAEEVPQVASTAPDTTQPPELWQSNGFQLREANYSEQYQSNRDVKPFSVGIATPELKHLDGGWAYNNFNQIR